MGRRRDLPSSTIHVGGRDLHACAAFRTKIDANAHATFKRENGNLARVIDHTKHAYGSQGGYWVYTAAKVKRR